MLKMRGSIPHFRCLLIKKEKDMRKRTSLMAAIVFAAVMVVPMALFGCTTGSPASPASPASPGSSSGSQQPEVPKGEQLPLDGALCVKSSYIPGYSGEEEPPFVVHNVAELLVAIGGDKRVSTSPDDASDPKMVSDAFADEFFATKDLLCAHYTAGSGSVGVDIDKAIKTDDGYEVLFKSHDVPQGMTGTADMAYWTVLIPVEKGSVDIPTKVPVQTYGGVVADGDVDDVDAAADTADSVAAADAADATADGDAGDPE